jgi:hypothetical protein
MSRFPSVVVLLLAIFAAPLSAQHHAVDSPRPALETASVQAWEPPAPHSTQAPFRATASFETSRRQGMRGVAHYLGGAVIGGWLGFVGAQVSHSDWDRGTTGELRQHRATWSLAGAALGVLAATLIPSSSPGGVALPERGFAPPSRALIATEDIRSSGAETAFDLIRGMRPEWLVTRGTNSWRETTRGTGSGMSGDVVITHQGDPTILVYLNGLRLGGVDKLSEVTTQSLSAVEYFDPHRAVLRFGSSAAHGVILLTTAVDAP